MRPGNPPPPTHHRRYDKGSGDHQEFRYDAWRVIAMIASDVAWFGTDEAGQVSRGGRGQGPGRMWSPVVVHPLPHVAPHASPSTHPRGGAVVSVMLMPNHAPQSSVASGVRELVATGVSQPRPPC